MDGSMYGWIDGSMDGWMDRWMDDIKCHVGQKTQILSSNLGCNRARSVVLPSHHRIAFSAGYRTF
jgi:hypothetical protein